MSAVLIIGVGDMGEQLAAGLAGRRHPAVRAAVTTVASAYTTGS
ncbi:hypothetical protein [Streptomyces chattanoogensis]|nr:hypothetical protein [Streptomyces chattanoogensis]